jgi:hypothetical protein
MNTPKAARKTEPSERDILRTMYQRECGVISLPYFPHNPLTIRPVRANDDNDLMTLQKISIVLLPRDRDLIFTEISHRYPQWYKVISNTEELYYTCKYLPNLDMFFVVTYGDDGEQNARCWMFNGDLQPCDPTVIEKQSHFLIKRTHFEKKTKHLIPKH